MPVERIKRLLVTNEQVYINHFYFIFNELWKDSVNAEERILTVLEGTLPQFMQVITDGKKASNIFIELATSIKKEVLLLLSNDISLLMMDKLGIVDHLIKSSHESGVNIKIICTKCTKNLDILDKISNTAPNIQILNGSFSSLIIFIVDNDRYIRGELKESNADTFENALGFILHSNS